MRNPARRILASPQATPTHNNFDILKEQDGDEAHVDDVVETQTEKGVAEDIWSCSCYCGFGLMWINWSSRRRKGPTS